jgi:ketosteroid isomerase-like protein
MKKIFTLIVICIVLMMVFVSCNSGKHTLTKEEMRKIVEERNNVLGECFKASDIDKLAAMYADSAKLCPDGRDFIHGREKIKAFWAESFKSSKTLDMDSKIFTVDGDENLIYETGKATSKIMYNDSLYNVTVKYINVWVKQNDGNYLLDIDFWNRNTR